jgi:hypothetical protein
MQNKLIIHIGNMNKLYYNIKIILAYESASV